MFSETRAEKHAQGSFSPHQHGFPQTITPTAKEQRANMSDSLLDLDNKEVRVPASPN